MKKRILPILLALMISIIPFESTFAYSGGLLNGLTMTRGSDIDINSITTAFVTDNNESTNYTVTALGTSGDTLWYKFNSPVTITDYKVLTSNAAGLQMKFYKADKTSITQIGVANNTKTSMIEANGSNLTDVTYISMFNTTGSTITVYEMDVYHTGTSWGLDNSAAFSRTVSGSVNSVNNINDNQLGNSATMFSGASVVYTFNTPIDVSKVFWRGDVTTASHGIITFYSITDTEISKYTTKGKASEGDFPVSAIGVKKIVLSSSDIISISEFDILGSTPVKTDVNNITVSNTTSTTSTVSWSAPTGYSGVTYTGSKVYLDGVLKSTLTPTGTTYELTGLTPNTNYNVKVTTLYSDASETTGVVKPFTTPPLVKTNVSNVSIDTITTSSATVSWLNPTGYSGVTYNGAKIYINNIYHHTSLPGETRYTFTNLTPNTDYTFKITASYSDASETSGVIERLKTLLSASDHVLITARIKGGGLNLIYNPSVSNDGDFGVITTDGATQEVFSNIGSITVTDHQGTGGGWNLSVQASPFQEVGGLGYSIPMGSLTLSGIQTVSQGLSFVKLTDSIIDSHSPVSLASANTNEGMGNTDITFPNQGYKLLLDTSLPLVDSSNVTGTDNSTPYEAIVTWSVSTGP